MIDGFERFLTWRRNARFFVHMHLVCTYLTRRRALEVVFQSHFLDLNGLIQSPLITASLQPMQDTAHKQLHVKVGGKY